MRRRSPSIWRKNSFPPKMGLLTTSMLRVAAARGAAATGSGGRLQHGRQADLPAPPHELEAHPLERGEEVEPSPQLLDGEHPGSVHRLDDVALPEAGTGRRALPLDGGHADPAPRRGAVDPEPAVDRKSVV